MSVTNVKSKWASGNLVFSESVAGNGAAIHFGVDDDGLDVKFFGATSGAYALWDESADKLIFDKADIRLGDSDIIEFGDVADIALTWDGTRFNVTQATVNSEIRWGVDGAGIDQMWYGDTASSYMMWDQSADKLIINAGSADLGTVCEADAYTVGGTAGLDVSGDGTISSFSMTAVKGIITAFSKLS